MVKKQIHLYQALRELRAFSLKQNTKSKKDSSYMICAYRGERGTKCFVGYFIKDEDYSVEMESVSVHELLISGIIPYFSDKGFNESHKLWLAIQNLHDTVSDAEKEFGKVAAARIDGFTIAHQFQH